MHRITFICPQKRDIIGTVSTVRACFSGSLIFECKTKSVVFWREFKLKIQNRFFKAGEKGTSSPFPTNIHCSYSE